MKVIFLLTQSLDSPSGLGRYTPLARELYKLGHQVKMLALHPDYANLKEKKIDLDGILVHYVAPMHVLKQGNKKSYYSTPRMMAISLYASWQLGKAALATPADILHIAKAQPMNSIAGWVTNHLRGNRLLVDCDDYEAASGNFSHKWQYNLVASIEKWIPKRVERVTTNTLFMKDKIATWGVPERKIFYIPNGVDRERFQAPLSSTVEKLRTQLGLHEKKVIIYVGSLSLVSHPVDLLFEAFKIIYDHIPTALLLVVGGGEDYESLVAKAQINGIGKAVLFCGRVPPDQVSTYYRLAQVSVDPVRNDDAAKGRSPLKLFESWASGVPFVTAEVGDRRQLLGEPLAGRLARPSDPASLAQEIIQLLEKPEQQKELARIGLERVQSYYWDRLAIKMEEVYKSIFEPAN